MTVSYRKVGPGKISYYTSDLEVDLDPLRTRSQPSAQWWVGGARSDALEGRLGIRSGERLCERDVDLLRSLAAGFQGETASRRPLVRNAGSPRRVALHDFTLSAPKSVSVAWALASDPLRAGIEAAHVHAARAFMSVMGDHVHSRTGAGGRVRAACPVVAVLFPHMTSRALDPQLHIHCVVLNVTLTPMGRGAAIEVQRALHWIGAAACVYHAELARGLRALEFRVQRVGMLFELADVPDSLVWEFSQRRRAAFHALDQEASARGVPAGEAIVSRRQIEAQILRTRPKKTARNGNALRRWWRRRASRLVGPWRPQECTDLRDGTYERAGEGRWPDGLLAGDLHGLPARCDAAGSPDQLKDWACAMLDAVSGALEESMDRPPAERFLPRKLDG